MGRLIDVSLPIHPDMLTWPSDPGVEVRAAKRLERGDSSNVSHLLAGTHTGTHVDAPWHFVEGGATIDEIDPEVLVGPAVVADMRHVADRIAPEDLERVDLPQGTSRVLFRTTNSDLWTREDVEFPDDYVALGEDGARWLVERDVKLVGTDFLSIEKKKDGEHPVHVALLSAGTVILEGLDLSDVTPELYLLYCLPLKIVGIDGAPARVFLAEP